MSRLHQNAQVLYSKLYYSTLLVQSGMLACCLLASVIINHVITEEVAANFLVCTICDISEENAEKVVEELPAVVSTVDIEDPVEVEDDQPQKSPDVS